MTNLRTLLLSAGLGLLAGCSTPVAIAPSAPPGAAAGPSGAASSPAMDIQTQEIVAVTDRIARGIVGLREIATAALPPHILLDPIVNNTTFPIDERAFLVRVRTELNSKSEGKVRFVDRDMLRRLDRERAAQASASGGFPASRGPDYILTGKLDGEPANRATDVSDSVLYTFRLTDARTGAVVWEDSAEIKRAGLQDTAPVEP